MDKIVKYIVLAVLFALCVPGVVFRLPYAPWSHAIVFTVAWYVASTLHPVLEGLPVDSARKTSLEQQLKDDPNLRPNQRAKLQRSWTIF